MTEIKKDAGKKDNRKALIIAFIIILLGINGVQWYLSNVKQQELTDTLSEKESEILKKEASLDSLSRELALRYDQIAKLGGDTTELGNKIRQLETDKQSLQKSANIAWGKVKRLERLKDEYTVMLREQDNEIQSLRKQTEELNKYNSELKKALQEKESSISELTKSKNDLNEKLVVAGQLKAENFQISIINKKGKQKISDEYKAKDIEKIRIDFLLSPNKIATVETKRVYLIVKEPSGSSLYDLQMGSGKFSVDGKDVYYTIKQDVLYERTGKAVSFYYSKGSGYSSGRYTADIYVDQHIVGSTSFIIK